MVVEVYGEAVQRNYHYYACPLEIELYRNVTHAYTLLDNKTSLLGLKQYKR